MDKSCSSFSFAILGLGLILGGVAVAQEQQDESSAATTAVTPPGPAGPITRGTPPLEGLLFVGTSQNTNDPTATLNDIFTVDPDTDTSTSILSATQVWGATADPANERVLFTRASGLTPPPGQIGGGDELMAVPYAGGAPVSIGRITFGGEGHRIDGLAMSGGVLYGVDAGASATNGFYTIDLGTLVATQVTTWADSISGLDADPDTGTIYGVNDTTGQLVSIATDGTITNVAAYPAGITDIDGLAVGNGFAYLVTDEGQPISVYDLASDVYVTDLTSPFASADVFSGAAYPAVPAVVGPQVGISVPALSFGGLFLLGLAVLGVGVLVFRR